MSSNIDSTLQERGARYGEFDEHSRITQNIKAAMVDSPNWPDLPPDMMEALDMTAHKIGRILNGDPYYLDSWHDIIGYIRLVEQRLERMEEAQKQEERVPMSASDFRAMDTALPPSTLRPHQGEITFDPNSIIRPPQRPVPPWVRTIPGELPRYEGENIRFRNEVHRSFIDTVNRESNFADASGGQFVGDPVCSADCEVCHPNSTARVTPTAY